MKHFYLAFLLLSLATLMSCKQHDPLPQPVRSYADDISKLESELFMVSHEFSKKGIKDADLVQNYYLGKGFTQIPIENNTYQMAGLYDNKAGKVSITQDNCIRHAYVKRMEFGVGLIVVSLPCTVGENIRTDLISQNYFFSDAELGAGNKCNKGNFVTIESYIHARIINNELLGLNKNITIVELCFDGSSVSKGLVVRF